MDPHSRVSLTLDLRHLSEEELRLFVDQAAGLSHQFADRMPVANLFTLIGLIADTWRSEPDFAGIGGSGPTDPTAPISHQVDDIAVVMSYAMAFVDDARLSPAVRGAWNSVIRNLAGEVRERQRKR